MTSREHGQRWARIRWCWWAQTFAGGMPGFILLDNHADPAMGDMGNGEALQDHACQLGHQSAVVSGAQ